MSQFLKRNTNSIYNKNIVTINQLNHTIYKLHYPCNIKGNSFINFPKIRSIRFTIFIKFRWYVVTVGIILALLFQLEFTQTSRYKFFIWVIQLILVPLSSKVFMRKCKNPVNNNNFLTEIRYL